MRTAQEKYILNFKFCRLSTISVCGISKSKPIDSKQQYRMFTTSNILSKEKVEELQKNPFFDKYAEKIAALQKWVVALLCEVVI